MSETYSLVSLPSGGRTCLQYMQPLLLLQTPWAACDPRIRSGSGHICRLEIGENLLYDQ